MYIEGSIEKYLNDLAAKKPAPGGGSAAALQAAAGVALMSMVVNYTIGNPKYKEHEDKAREMLKKCEEARKNLQSLVDADVEAYTRLSEALNTGKGNGQRSAEEALKLDAAYKEALIPPYEVCWTSANCMKLCAELVNFGNKNLVTDTATAAIFLEGAFFAAKYSVYANLKYIKDMDFIGSIHNMLQPLEEKMPKMKEEILEKCEEVIK